MCENKKNAECTVIALCNQKGGVAKTTSSVAMSAALAELGYEVLLIDNDPQGNSSQSLGKKKPDGMQITIATIMDDLIHFRTIPSDKGIIRTEEGFDILPSDNTYSGIEMQLISIMSREYFLKKYIEGIRNEYDYVIIDCPPNLGMLTINALVAADELLIPAEAQDLSALSVEQLLGTVDMVRQYPNPNLKIKGIFLTMYDGRRKEDRLMREAIRKGFSSIELYSTTIPFSVRAKEAVTRHQSIISYDSKGKVAEAYRELIKEVICNA